MQNANIKSEPSANFGCCESLLLWRGDLSLRIDTEISRRSCIEILQRSCKKDLRKHLASILFHTSCKRFCRDSLQEILHKDACRGSVHGPRDPRDPRLPWREDQTPHSALYTKLLAKETKSAAAWAAQPRQPGQQPPAPARRLLDPPGTSTELAPGQLLHRVLKRLLKVPVVLCAGLQVEHVP